MNATAQSPRLVNSELLQRLDPLEQVIAAKFLNEGRWVKDEEKTQE